MYDFLTGIGQARWAIPTCTQEKKTILPQYIPNLTVLPGPCLTADLYRQKKLNAKAKLEPIFISSELLTTKSYESEMNLIF